MLLAFFSLFFTSIFLMLRLPYDYFIVEYASNYLLFLFIEIFFNSSMSIPLSIIVYAVSVISSFLFSSFLTSYGILVINMIALILVMFTLLLHFKYVFLDNLESAISIKSSFAINSVLNGKVDFILDYLSYNFLLLVIIIAIFALLYSFSYFRGEPNLDRFLAFLNFFIFSMIILVISNNLIVFFLGWELIGISSFLLINFWSNRVSTFKSSFKAFIFNKLSDCFLLIAIVITSIIFNDISFFSINATVTQQSMKTIEIMNIPAIEVIAFFFMAAAFIKSAQFGCHIWLPDSMEAPVPASALIHSATLVSAGIFLILRLNVIFLNTTWAYNIILLFGVLTALYGGLVAAFQTDLKKILAYSTISHCGFLMVLTSFNSLDFVLLYLFIHGFFKASSFLAVGNVIRYSRDYQDLKKMGGLWKVLPFECYSLLFSLTNLAGLPFFFGFFLKTMLASFNESSSIIINILLFLSFFFSAIYSFKIFFYVFFDTKKGNKFLYIKNSQKTFCVNNYTASGLANICSIFCLNVVATIVVLVFFYLKIKSHCVYSSLAEVTNSSSYLNFFSLTKGNLFNLYAINFIAINLAFVFIYFKFNSINVSADYNSFFYTLIILVHIIILK